MKKRHLAYLLAALLMGVSRSLAAGSAATVTAAVNHVTHGSAQSTATSPAKVGTQLQDGEYLKTGPASRAEMELANKTITRMGANTIFNYTASSNTIDLQAGTILFSKPKDGRQMNIKTAAVTAAIVGTTGIEQQTGKTFLFGLVEGTSIITIGGVDYTVHGGQMLLFIAPGPPVIFNFDIAKFLKTSKLITAFPPDLPNEEEIQEALADYLDDVDRGFITPPKAPYFVYTDDGTPTIPILGRDSAGNALDIPPPPKKFWDSARTTGN